MALPRIMGAAGLLHKYATLSSLPLYLVLGNPTPIFSAKMVIMWFLGDSFKTLYFVLRGSPVQFLMCGSVQILVDMLILYQVMSYDTDRAD